MTQESLNDLQKQNPAGYEKYAFCGYRRIGTYGQWFPLDYDTHVKRLQAKIEALEAQISQLSNQPNRPSSYPENLNPSNSYVTP